MTVKNRFYASAGLIGLKLGVLTISPARGGSIAHSGSQLASVMADRVTNSRENFSRRYIFLIIGKYASILLLSYSILSIFYDYMLQISNYSHYCWFSDENVFGLFWRDWSKFFFSGVVIDWTGIRKIECIHEWIIIANVRTLKTLIVYVYEASDAQTLVTQCGAPPPSPYGGGRPFPQVHKGGGQYSLLDIVYVDPYIYVYDILYS